ncbi:hypothetical protein [Maridesulfovibrio sp.]|uniref:hypothetical protein n=1 Tax=unclassified Maridesulfovibrio TaxID=2794999 RepID=UPI003B000D61
MPSFVKSDNPSLDSFVRFTREMGRAGMKLEAVKLLNQALKLNIDRQAVQRALDELTTQSSKFTKYIDDKNYFACAVNCRLSQLSAAQSGACLHPLFISMPHSGSTYISKKVAESINSSWLPVHAGYELRESLLDWTKLNKSIRENGVSICHIPSSRINNIVLRQHVSRCIVHIRDPRQSILSWIHKIEIKLNNKEYDWFERIIPALPERYLTMSLEDKLWCHLENEFTQRVEMVQGWMNYQDSEESPVRIFFTTHQELKEFPELLFSIILHYFNLSATGVNLEINRRDNRKYNFRKGSSNEWMDIYSEEQKEYADKRLPENIKIRFGWTNN